MQFDSSSGKYFHLKRLNIVHNVKEGKNCESDFTNCHSNSYPGNVSCYLSDSKISIMLYQCDLKKKKTISKTNKGVH